MSQPTEAQRTSPTPVVGLTAWTSNAAESQPGSARIPELWGRFAREGWFERLEHIGAVGARVAVYTDYETDVSGNYRIVVGREVPKDTPVLPDLQAVSIPVGRYVVFRLRGTLPGIVKEGWRNVWTLCEQSGAFQRALSADLEKYHDDGAGVDIWIAVR